MPDKKEIEELYEELTEDNKNIISLIAQGMFVAQTNAEVEKHVPRID